jgi:ketosteroid isomerase-like protein
MIADEIAMSSAMLDAIPDISADFRDQKIDVFGDTAVETAFFVVTGTLPAGVELELKLRITSVWVRAADGWKIAHEHNTLTTNIVEDRFAGDEAAIRAAMLELDDVVNRQDWDALRSSHLDGEKFSKLKRGQGRQDFEEMIAEEIANMSVMKDFKIDFRDLKIDVFGDVAVASSPALYTWTDQSGKAIERDMLATMVWVKTAEGWRIAHEHNSLAQAE